jgi:hypothetical protein
LILLWVAAAAWGADRVSEIRRPPFFVEFAGMGREARGVANELEQIRWAMERELGIAPMELWFPVRVVVSEAAGTLPLLSRAGYVMRVNGRTGITLKQRAALLQMILERNLRRVPVALENSILYVFSAMTVTDGTIVRIGDVIPGMKQDRMYQRVHMLLTDPAYAGSMRVYLQNLSQGSENDVACRNAFGKGEAAIEAEVDAYARSGVWKSRQLTGAAIDAQRDFTEYRVDAPANELTALDLMLVDAASQKAAREGYAALERRFPEEPGPIEGLALASKALGLVRDFDEEARRAIERSSNNARVYFELARTSKDARESWTMMRRAVEANERWPEAHYELGIRENDPARKLNWLAKAATLARRNADYWRVLAQECEAQGKMVEAVNAWAQARLAASSAEQRAALEAIRKEADQRRAIAIQDEERRRREAAAKDLERIREEQNARVRAAEARLNEELEKKAGGKPVTGQIYSWNEVQGIEETVKGRLVEVVCEARTPNQRKLVVMDAKKQRMTLLVPDVGKLVIVARNEGQEVRCGAYDPAPGVTVGFKRQESVKTKTSGVAGTLEFQ